MQTAQNDSGFDQIISHNLKPASAPLALGQVWLAVNQIEGAIICAKAGLEEVGHDYAPLYIEDDTELKLLLAEKRIEKGHLKDGANMMLRVLENRLLLHSKRHQKA